MALFLKILGGLAALGLGIWMGLGRRDTRSHVEIERALTPGGSTRRVKRHFTPIDLFRKDRRASERRRQNTRRAFDMKARMGRSKDDAN